MAAVKELWLDLQQNTCCHVLLGLGAIGMGRGRPRQGLGMCRPGLSKGVYLGRPGRPGISESLGPRARTVVQDGAKRIRHVYTTLLHVSCSHSTRIVAPSPAASKIPALLLMYEFSINSQLIYEAPPSIQLSLYSGVPSSGFHQDLCLSPLLLP